MLTSSLPRVCFADVKTTLSGEPLSIPPRGTLMGTPTTRLAPPAAPNDGASAPAAADGQDAADASTAVAAVAAVAASAPTAAAAGSDAAAAASTAVAASAPTAAAAGSDAAAAASTAVAASAPTAAALGSDAAAAASTAVAASAPTAAAAAGSDEFFLLPDTYAAFAQDIHFAVIKAPHRRADTVGQIISFSNGGWFELACPNLSDPNHTLVSVRRKGQLVCTSPYCNTPC